MRNIVFFINSMGGGGAERILSMMMNDLQYKFKINLVLMENKIEFDIPLKVNIINLDIENSSSKLRKFLNIFIYSYKYAKICNSLKASSSFSLTVRSNFINALSKIFRNKSQTIIYEVCTPSMQYKENNISSKIIKLMIKLLYPLVDVLVTNSHGVTKDLKTKLLINKNIETIYSPIDIDYIVKLSAEEFNLNSNGYLKFITIGRLDNGKNHEMMIKAFSEIRHKKSHLFILGDGELKCYLQELVISLNLTHRVFFLGFDKNPFKYLKNADIFLFSSSFEGFPTVLIEALACNLPIISTDCLSGPKEILSNNIEKEQLIDKIEFAEFGVLTPVNDKKLFVNAINGLLENQKLLYNYKINALDRAKSFSKEGSIKKIENILRRGIE